MRGKGSPPVLLSAPTLPVSPLLGITATSLLPLPESQPSEQKMKVQRARDRNLLAQRRLVTALSLGFTCQFFLEHFREHVSVKLERVSPQAAVNRNTGDMKGREMGKLGPNGVGGAVRRLGGGKSRPIWVLPIGE